MLFRGNVRTIVIASVFLASCGTHTRVSDDQSSALAAAISEQCSKVQKPELGEGTVCFDNGFRISRDDFSFANWGRSSKADANVTVQTLIDLFGHSAVCLPGATNSCVMRPATIQKLEQWNTALTGGRCEGIATLSNRLYLANDLPEDFAPGIQRVSDLHKTDGKLTQDIVKWWATQFLTEVADRAAASRTKSPLQLVNDLISGLSHKLGYTLGMYFGASGHSVVPFAVTQRDGTFVIHVYDNNYPGERREVLIYAATDTWSFPRAHIGLDGSPIDWSGSTGTLELVPMSAREGPFTCSFCNDSDSPQRVLTIASRDPQSPGYALVRTRSGKTLAVTPDAISNSIPGATIEIGKGSTNGVATISIPESAGDFDVSIRRVNAEVPAGDVIVNVRRRGSADIQIVGNLAESTLDGNTINTPLLAVRTGDTTIHAPQNSNARISVAAGTNISRTNLSARSSLVIQATRANSIEVSLKGANNTVATARFSADASTRVIESQWTLDSNQQLVASKETLSAVSVSSSAPVSFSPRQAHQTTTSTTMVPSSIVISRPD